MTMKRLLSVALSAALLAGVLTGCGGGNTTGSSASAGSGASAETASGGDGTLRLAWAADIQTMDVHKTTDNYMVPLNIFDRLFEIENDENGTPQLVNSLAADYTVSEDGLTYDFTLQEGVTFSDGTPLTANDVKYTFTRMISLPESVQSSMGSMIAGAAELQAGTAQELTGITVTDDTHFTITLTAPFAGFLYELATPACSIMSEANVTAAGDSFGLDPAQTIGSGPYVVTSWTRDSGMVLDLNPNYWGETPDVTHVEISVVPDASTMSMMFQSGELDILDCDYIDSAVVDSTYRTQYADQIVTGNRLATTYLALNENIEPLGDVRVRKAIQMAIDRQTILDSVYSGDGSLVDGIYPEGLIGYSADNQGWLTYDPEGAKALLAEAGYADGFDVTMQVNTLAASKFTEIAQAVAYYLGEVGINVTLENLDTATARSITIEGQDQEKVSGLFTWSWASKPGLCDSWMTGIIMSDGMTSYNVIEGYDELCSEILALHDEEAKIPLYQELQQKLVDDPPFLYLFQLNSIYAISSRLDWDVNSNCYILAFDMAVKA